MAPKTVLITGCSKGGIGDALAKEFHKKGLRVFASARNLAKIEHLKELGLDIVSLDVTDDTSIKQAVESVRTATGGGLDYLVNNSGGGYFNPLLDVDIAAAKRMFDVNVFALIAVTQAFSPLLIASKGTIVNIGSIAGKAPIPWQGMYNASKAAVNLLTDQLRLELAPFGVNAINIITGGIKTQFFENMETVKLVPGSLYQPAKEEVEYVMSGAIIEKDGEDADVYAAAVVRNVLKSKPKKNLWIGSGAGVIWFTWSILWATVWDFVFQRPFKLPVVSQKIRAAQKSE